MDAAIPCLGLKTMLLYLHLDNIGLNKLEFTLFKKTKAKQVTCFSVGKETQGKVHACHTFLLMELSS